ncbi:hypothetical protein T09_6966, partial [Trichinella sp. T9]
LEEICRNSCINIHQMDFHSTTCFISSPIAPAKITSSLNFFCNISANTRSYTVRPVRRFWKVLRQINRYVSNKWPLKLPCAYLNTQQSSR